MKARRNYFRATTPGGRQLEGEIYAVHAARDLSGALLIESVDGQAGRALLLGMPEIPYWHEQSMDLHQALSVTASVKLDGTAIIFSPLFWNGRYLELICRTRGMPVLTNMKVPQHLRGGTMIEQELVQARYRQWVDLVSEVADIEAIEGLCRTQRATLVFELYGQRNRHTLDYDTELDLRLHTMRKGKYNLPYQELQAHAARWGLSLAPQVAPVNGGTWALSESDLHQQISTMEEVLDSRNDPAAGRFCVEGVVISINRARQSRLYKAKPASMVEYYRLTGEMAPMTVRHELHKLAEWGLPSDYETAMTFLGRVYGEMAQSNRALLAREYWGWYVDSGKGSREGVGSLSQTAGRD